MFWIEILQSYRGGEGGREQLYNLSMRLQNQSHFSHWNTICLNFIWGDDTISFHLQMREKTPNFSLIFGYSHIFLCFNSTITFTYTFISKSACWNTDKTNILYLWKPKDSHKFNGVFSQVFTSTALNMQPNAPGKALGLSTAAEITVL